MDKEKEFLKECNEWLNPLGFTLHVTYRGGGNGESEFMFTSEQYKVTIVCGLNMFGDKYCYIFDMPCQMLFQLRTGKLQFKHPYIERFIKAGDHYSRLCQNNPVF